MTDLRTPPWRATIEEGFRIVVLARSVYPLHGHGGLERHVGDLVRHLLRRNAQVTLITRPSTPIRKGPSENERAARLAEFLALPGLDVKPVPYQTFPLAGRRGTTVLDRSTAYLWFGWRAGRLAANLVARGHGSIVHGLGASAVGYARARRRDRIGTVPLVFNPQGLEEFGAAGTLDVTARLKRVGYAPLRRAVTACAQSADAVIATDRTLEAAVVGHLGIPAERLRLIPNAIDVDSVSRLASPEQGRELRRRLGLPSDEPVILSVGRIERNKGFHIMVEALARLRERPWRWVLVGDGPFRNHVERRIGECGLGARCLLLGQVSDRDLHASYEAASLFVHPTLYEGSSLVTLEAMAHRRAVVATRAGGLPDKVEPHVSGWLVDPGDPVSLAKAIGEALEHPERLREMGAQGRRIITERFSWTAAADRLLELYTELTARQEAVSKS